MSRRNNQLVKSRFDSQKTMNSDSDYEASDSEELPNVNDKDIQKYFAIHPVEIFGKEDCDRVNLRKSLVQRHFRFSKRFASSTPARGVPGNFNKSSFIVSPILASDEPKRSPRRRENGSFKNSTRNLRSSHSQKGEEQDESSLERESPDARKKPAQHRKVPKRRSAQERAGRQAHRTDESTSESESPDVFKKPYNMQPQHNIAKQSRAPHEEGSATHRSLQEKEFFEIRDESESPGVQTGARNERRNGSLKIAAQPRASQRLETAGIDLHTNLPDKGNSTSRKRTQILSDCERDDESSSNSESTLKGGTDMHTRSQDANLPDKKNSIRERSRTLLELEKRRGGPPSESKTTASGPDLQKNGTPQKLDRTGSAHRSLAEKKRDRSQVLSVRESGRGESSSESETTLKESVVQTNRTGSTHRRFVDKKREPNRERRGESSSESDTTLKEPVVQINKSPQRSESTHRSFADKRRERAPMLPDRESRGECASESEMTLKEPVVQNNRSPQRLDRTRSAPRGFTDKKRERAPILPDRERRGESASESETTLKEPVVQNNRSPRKLDRADRRSPADRKRDRAKILSELAARGEPPSETTVVQNNKSPQRLDRTGSTHKSFVDKKRARAQVPPPDLERYDEPSSLESQLTLNRLGVQYIRSPQKTRSADKRECSQVFPSPTVQKERHNGNLKTSRISQKLETLGADAHRSLSRIEKSIRMHSPASGERQQNDFSPQPPLTDLHERPSSVSKVRSKIPLKLQSATSKVEDSPPARARLIRTIAQVHSHRNKRRDESTERQRPASRNASGEREPEKGRSDWPMSRETIEVSKDVSLQAPEGEPMRRKLKSRRNQGDSVRNDEEPEDLYCSKTSASDLQHVTRKGAEKETNADEGGRGNNGRKGETPIVPGKEIDGVVCDTRNDKNNLPLGDSRMKEIYKNNFYTSSMSEYNTSVRSDADHSRLSRIHSAKVNHVMTPPATESSVFEGTKTPSFGCGTDDFVKKANNINRVVTNLMLSRMESLFPTGSEEVGDRLPSGGSQDDTITEVQHRKKTAKNKKNIEPTQKTTGKNKTATGKRGRRKKEDAKAKTATSKRGGGPKKKDAEVQQKGGDVEAIASGSEEVPGLRRSKRKRKQRDFGLPEVILYVNEKNRLIVSKSVKKKRTEKNKGNSTRRQPTTDVSIKTRRTPRRNQQVSVEPSPGSGDVFDEGGPPSVRQTELNQEGRRTELNQEGCQTKNKGNSTRWQPTTDVSIKTRRTPRRNQQVSVEPSPGSGDVFDEGGPPSVRQTELNQEGRRTELNQEGRRTELNQEGCQTELDQEGRRKTRHLNMRINNSLYKIEWFNDGQQTLLDLESDTSNISNTQITHLIDVPSVAASGYLVIGPSGSKPAQISKKYSLMFYVIEGTANVSVHDRFFIGGPNCNFFIPFGHEYRIQNLSSTKKLTLFCVRIPP